MVGAAEQLLWIALRKLTRAVPAGAGTIHKAGGADLMDWLFLILLFAMLAVGTALKYIDARAKKTTQDRLQTLRKVECRAGVRQSLQLAQSIVVDIDGTTYGVKRSSLIDAMGLTGRTFDAHGFFRMIRYRLRWYWTAS